MSFLSILRKYVSNKVTLFLLDVESDRMITKVCKFNPYQIQTHYRQGVLQRLRKKFLNNRGKKLTVEIISLWKLVIYAQFFEYSEYPDEIIAFNEIKIGISTLYDSLKDELDGDLALEAMVYVY